MCRVGREVVLAGYEGDETTAQAALEDPDPVIRAAALSALARMGSLGSEHLEVALGDGDATVRRHAAELGARRADLAAALVGPLIGRLGDEDHRVAEAAALALGELAGHANADAEQAAVLALARTATTHEDGLCRESSVAALGAIGHPLGLAAVLAATDDRATVRRRAVLALAAFEGDEVEAALRRLTGDRDLQVRQAAEDLLSIGEGHPT